MPAQNVSVIIVNAQTREVLLKRKGFRAWSLPGGQIEQGETWETAAVREALEETRYRVEVGRLVGKYRWLQHLDPGSLTYVALAYVVEGASQAYSGKTVAASWFPIMVLPRGLSRFGRTALADAISEYPFAVQRTLDLPPHQVMLFWLRRHTE